MWAYFFVHIPSQIHPEAEQFPNKGWPFYERMAALLPRNLEGQCVYHPGHQRKAADVSIPNEPMASQVEDGPDSQESFTDSQESVRQAETQVSIVFSVSHQCVMRCNFSRLSLLPPLPLRPA